MIADIKNIIFDVGNVIVKWSPEDIISNTFPSFDYNDKNHFINLIFGSNTWRSLNLGIVEENDAKQIFMNSLNIDQKTINELFANINSTQVLIPETVKLMKQLKSNQYSLYGLTDNVHFIIAYLRQRYDFWKHLKDVTVSAEVGMMKPDQAIFNYVITKNNILPDETVFIDDHLPNIISARKSGLHTIHFTNTEDCIEDLEKLGIKCHE